VAENTQVRQLFRDALSGKLNRREVFQRGIALGLSANVIGMLALNAVKVPSALAAEEGKPSTTFYSWMLDLHPLIQQVADDSGVKLEIAPTQNFGNDRFIAEAKDQTSTWDSYGGVTPFLEMIGLVATGTIEPWDAYVTPELMADFSPATLAEGTYQGKFYVWPLLLDICVMSWNAGIVQKAGLEPEASPKTWDEFLANAKTIKDSGAAQFGCTWDNRDWRSLIPVTHSFSTDVYDPETGLFKYSSDATVSALEVLKASMEYANPDILAAAGVDNTVLVDEAAFAAEQAGLYFKYQNAPLRQSANWPDPTQLRLDKMPVPEGGAGGTVFWDTGSVLFKYGANKQAAVDFFTNLSKSEPVWEEAVVGNEDEGVARSGQLPVLQSVWAAWAATPPDWLTANPWALSIYQGLASASAIAPSLISIAQFDTARPEWHKYLSGEEADAKTALTNAENAAYAAWKAAAEAAGTPTA
jgi:ABC-type glycerol-3-phosphate transport system substrate-binding protein